MEPWYWWLLFVVMDRPLRQKTTSHEIDMDPNKNHEIDMKCIYISVRPRSILAEPNRTEIFSAAIWPNRDLPRFSRRQYGRTEIYRDCEICCRTEPNRDCRELLTKGTGSVPVSTNAKIAFVAICSPTYRRLIVTGGRILLRRISLLVSQAN